MTPPAALATLALTLAALAGSARAQTGAAAVSMPQLSAPDRPGAASVQPDSPTLDTASGRGRADLVSAGPPIGEGRPTAEASPDLSTRAQGRAVGAAAVGGIDRCEPNTPAANTELCRRRLEARAGEFSKAGAAPVTAEGRLLILTDPQGGAQSVDQATRRLGSSPGVDTLAGSAASTIAGVLSGMSGSTTAAAATGASPAGAATALPAGVPSSVVVSPH